MITALILSGGTGTRLGSDIPKQYIEVDSRPIISYCFETLAASRLSSLMIYMKMASSEVFQSQERTDSYQFLMGLEI